MRLFLLCFFLLVLQVQSQAQPLALYVNMQNEVMVWDRGMLKKVDFLPPTNYKIGRVAIPYLDNSRTFRIYYGGSMRQVNIGFTNAFFATDNLVAYLNQKSLNVFDKGVLKNLTSLCDQYFVSDSLILYLDGFKSEYKVYYNGQILPMENFIPDSVLSTIKVADNIIAYNNFANQFCIFYHGARHQQEVYSVGSFEAGRNTVAYMDIDKRFKIYHSGKTIVADNFPPNSYKVGDNVVAFVTNDGRFKIFYDDSVRDMGYFSPNYLVADNIIAYKDPSGWMKIFYKGNITDMENYFPTEISAQYNSLAYINTNNTLRLFSEGEVYDVTNADLTNWQLNYDIVSYQIGQGIFKVYYKGTEY